KLNMIWKKAHNTVMSDNKLQNLKQELLQHDEKELKWKELKLHGGDIDGKMEMKLRNNLIRILEKHGLSRIADAVLEGHGTGYATDTNVVRDMNSFGDRRLEQLWSLASDQGKFTKAELHDLQTEFKHHKIKMGEYDKLLNELQKQHDISDNSVLIHDRMKEHEVEQLKKKLKDKHDDLTENYINLKEKVTGEQQVREFSDHRVMELWEKAKKKGFTEQELHSIKEELKHFDHKISKHEHYKKQVLESEARLAEGEELSHDHEELKQKEK
ncbi:predicted protein, partial [Nematostella vectensis]